MQFFPYVSKQPLISLKTLVSSFLKFILTRKYLDDYIFFHFKKFSWQSVDANILLF